MKKVGSRGAGRGSTVEQAGDGTVELAGKQANQSKAGREQGSRQGGMEQTGGVLLNRQGRVQLAV